MLVAETTRRAPQIELSSGQTARVQLINPENGKAADYNPFADALPSGQVIGVLADQWSGGGSLVGNVLGGIGNVIGGALSTIGGSVKFVFGNPIARGVLTGVGITAAVLSCTGATVLTVGVASAACVPLAAAGLSLLAIEVTMTLASAIPAALANCSSDKLVACGLNVATIGLAVGGAFYGLPAAVATARAAGAGTKLALASARADTPKYKVARLKGNNGEELTALRETLMGSKIVDRGASVSAAGATAAPDLQVIRFMDRMRRNGPITHVEAKWGSSLARPNQAAVLGCTGGEVVRWGKPGGLRVDRLPGGVCPI